MQPVDAEEGMEVSFWGTRGSISTPGRATEKYGGNTPCVAVRCGDAWIILDAGTGIRNLGIELASERSRSSLNSALHLLLSHTHWDHIQGLPFFDPLYMDGMRLAIYGSPSKRGLLEEVLRGQMDFDYFPVQMSSLSAELTIQEMNQSTLEIGPFIVDWEEQIHHPGGSVRYGIRHGGTRVVYASDVELNKFFLPGATPEQLADQRAYFDFIRGADLLIADGQYTAEEYPSAKGYGHTTIPLLIEIAYEAEVKQLAVYHHNPPHSDSALDALWQKYHPVYMSKDRPMNVFWAREGQALPL